VYNRRNRAARSYLRTAVKKFDAAVAGGDRDTVSAAYTAAVKAVDKAAAHGLIHRNNAARKVSSLTVKYNAVK
jgi:small subunit ribosomal protein S20